LVNATHVFLCEPLINTAIELQAIARVHRIGQHRATTVWMYLVSGTVEEAIYDLSVSRRLSHITAKKKEEETLASSMAHLNGNDKEGIDETTIDSANSMELQNTALSKIIAAGASGGEIVKKDDLWQCLFGNLSKNKESGHHSMGADSEVGKFLRAEAAKQRAAKK
jgi:E3 ubiquitin-protein ligase SHPRH